MKTIAIELIRQTPLEAVKYLDILTFANSWNKRSADKKEKYFLNADTCNVCSESSISSSTTTTTINNTIESSIESNQHQQQQTDINRNNVKILQSPSCQTNNNNNEGICVELLLKKCQNVENYVSVKEKLVLFESLCKLGRVRSSEDVSIRTTIVNNTNGKRARSLHDLSNCIVNNGVREICKYFERKTGENAKFIEKKSNKRLIYSDTSLYKKIST